MARLIFSALASLDGYINDARGEFGWAEPDEQVHVFVNDLTRPIGPGLGLHRADDARTDLRPGGG